MPTPCCQTGKLGRQKYHGPVLRTTLLGYFAIFTLLCIFPSLLFSILLSPNTLSSFLPFIFLLSAVKAAPLGSSCLGRTSGAFPVSQTSQALSSLSGLPPNPHGSARFFTGMESDLPVCFIYMKPCFDSGKCQSGLPFLSKS